MKNLNSKLGLIAAAGLMAATFTTTAGAQDTHLFRVHVPFAFLAGDQTMPAGDYTIRLDPRFNLVDLAPTPGTGLHRVMLKHNFVTRPHRGSSGGLLTFAKYGDKLVLHGVWARGEEDGHEVVTSKSEIELVRANGGNAADTDTSVTIH
jgi:hypothetical protein